MNTQQSEPVVLLTLKNMQTRWPRSEQHVPGLLEAIVRAAPGVFATYGLDTALVVAHAMAQFSVECCDGTRLRENLDYTAERLLTVFPRYFTPESAQRAAHKPQAIGEIVYGGRLGNAPAPSTDGFVYRGAGLLQVTGKGNVAGLQKALDRHQAGFNIVDHPELLVDPQHALECGVAMFVELGCLPLAKKDDVLAVSKAVNGGTNGLEERRKQIVMWKAELKAA